MVERSDDTGEARRAAQARVVAIVQRYQRLRRRAVRTTSPVGKARLRRSMQRCLELLWDDLKDPLRSVAARWYRSGVMQEIAGQPEVIEGEEDKRGVLAKHAFFYIIDQLDGIRLRLELNPIGFLLTIAWRGLAGEEHDIYSSPKGSRFQIVPLPEHRDDAEEHGYREQLASDEDLEAQLASRLDMTACRQLIEDFWRRSFTSLDYQIMYDRWIATPPLSFASIAEPLGEGWNPTAVRKRHQRALERTREYLEQRGWLEHP